MGSHGKDKTYRRPGQETKGWAWRLQIELDQEQYNDSPNNSADNLPEPPRTAAPLCFDSYPSIRHGTPIIKRYLIPAIMSLFELGKYEHAAATFADYDTRAPKVARLLIDAIQQSDPRVAVEHIGSTAVPGCRGKGVIDLAVTYNAGDLEPAKAAVDELGFRKQTGRDPWPETRPMRVASVSALGGVFLVHAHVIERNGPEHKILIAFRDALRRDSQLLTAYEKNKQESLALGITDSVEYSNAKDSFIATILSRLANP
jgi:GrpB-like predicted nucleotidyltransferase (UPF0157 family)